jgi:hypothetical protein
MRQLQSALDQHHAVIAAEPEVGEHHVDRLAFEHIHRAANVLRDVGIVFILE